MSNPLEIREFQIRETVTDQREVLGIAVPYDQDTNIGGYVERFAPGSAIPAENTMLFWRHQDPIGKIIEHEQTDAGLMIRARFTEGVQLADEALALVRDGVIDKFSVGFEPMESRTEADGSVTRISAMIREVSLVPLPAYSGAAVQEVRESVPEQEKEDDIMSESVDLSQDLAEVRESVEVMERKLETLAVAAPAETVVDTRSAGEVLKAIARGDEAELRAYAGGTSADAIVRTPWVGDLTRLVDEAAVMRQFFGSGNLPSEGNFIEYGQLKANTVDVDIQAAEGDDLVFGLVELETKTAPVKTYGGYSTLSRQEIERSSTNILDTTLRAQAIAAGKAINGSIRAAYVANHAAQVTAGNAVAVGATPTYASWVAAAVDAAVKFEALGLTMDALIVDKATFKSLTALEGADGRPVFLVTGAGSNNIGELSVPGLSGSLAGITVVMDAGLTDEVAFVNRQAIRFYGSAVVRLQDENIINLSKDYSLYTYGATATEIPAAVVAVVDALA